MEPIPYKPGGFPWTSSPLAFEYLELLVCIFLWQNNKLKLLILISRFQLFSLKLAEKSVYYKWLSCPKKGIVAPRLSRACKKKYITAPSLKKNLFYLVGDGKLSYGEFIELMKDRVHRGFRVSF